MNKWTVKKKIDNYLEFKPGLGEAKKRLNFKYPQKNKILGEIFHSAVLVLILIFVGISIRQVSNGGMTKYSYSKYKSYSIQEQIFEVLSSAEGKEVKFVYYLDKNYIMLYEQQYNQSIELFILEHITDYESKNSYAFWQNCNTLQIDYSIISSNDIEDILRFYEDYVFSLIKRWDIYF